MKYDFAIEFKDEETMDQFLDTYEDTVLKNVESDGLYVRGNVDSEYAGEVVKDLVEIYEAVYFDFGR